MARGQDRRASYQIMPDLRLLFRAPERRTCTVAAPPYLGANQPPAVMAPALPADPLARREARRTLVVFAPFERHPAFEVQQHLVRSAHAELDARGVDTAAVLTVGTSRVGTRLLDAHQAASLSARYGVPAGVFCSLLLDRDGTELARSADPLPPKVVFQRLG
jgi:hypothetical protein